MSMPANQPVIRRGAFSSKLARFKLPIPPRIATFFDGPELQEYDGRRACGFKGWTSDTKMKVRFGSRRLREAMEDIDDTPATLLPIASVGAESNLFAVDTASPTLTVHFYDHEVGWAPFCDGFDAFLGRLLRKGEKTPSELFTEAHARARELNEAHKYPEVIALLEPLVAQFPEDMSALDDTRERVGSAYNLIGIAHEKAGDLARARACYERGVALDYESAGLNILDLDFESRDYARLIAYAEQRRAVTWAWHDAYAWFHLRNYLGRAYLMTNRPSDAVRAYHQISGTSAPEKVAEAVQDLRDLLEEQPGADRTAAESILAWLARPPVPPPAPERLAALRTWWAALPDPVTEAVRSALELDDDAEPTDDQLQRATEIDDLSVTHAELDGLAWLAMFTRLDDLSLAGTGLTDGDLAAIARHTALRELDLGENKLTTLQPLAALVRLERLSAGDNPLVSLDGVEAMRELQKLHAPTTQIASLEPLRGLPELLEVSVYESKVEDLAPLADSPRLKAITAFSCPLARGIAALAKLRWLAKLECGSEGPLDEIDALRAANPDADVEHWTHRRPERPDPGDPAERRAWWSGLAPVWRERLAPSLPRGERDSTDPSDDALRALVLQDRISIDGALPDLEPLRRFAHVRYLCVEGTGIADLAPIAALPRLRDLIARDNPLASLAPLAAARVLEELYLQRCGLTSLAGLEGCPALREIAGEDNHIADLAPLAELHDLRELDLEGNQVASVAALAGKRHLHTLRLGQNRITDVAPLAACTALRTLEIWANPGVRGAVALAELPDLRKLISHGALPPREVEELRRRRPDLLID